MKNYVLVYFGGGDSGDMPMEEVTKVWGEWFGQLGEMLVDGGNPFNSGAQVVEKSGVSGVKSPASGYSIVKAVSMQAAADIAKNCPLLKYSANGSVQVYEALPM